VLSYRARVERTQLLRDVVDLDARIIDTTSKAARAKSDREFEALIADVRRLRQQRAEIQANLMPVVGHHRLINLDAGVRAGAMFPLHPKSSTIPERKQKTPAGIVGATCRGTPVME
jgi:hypothetical protein